MLDWSKCQLFEFLLILKVLLFLHNIFYAKILQDRHFFLMLYPNQIHKWFQFLAYNLSDWEENVKILEHYFHSFWKNKIEINIHNVV